MFLKRKPKVAEVFEIDPTKKNLFVVENTSPHILRIFAQQMRRFLKSKDKVAVINRPIKVYVIKKKKR